MYHNNFFNKFLIYSNRNISHSAIGDMTIIQQDPPAFSSNSSSVLSAMDRRNYSEDTPSSFYSKYFFIKSIQFSIMAILITDSKCCRNSGLDDLLTKSSKPASRDSDWDMLTDFTPASKQPSSSSYGVGSSTPSYGSSSSNSKSSSSSRDPAPSSASNNGEAQKKFGNAKAISSDQFFQDSGAGDV